MGTWRGVICRVSSFCLVWAQKGGIYAHASNVTLSWDKMHWGPASAGSWICLR